MNFKKFFQRLQEGSFTFFMISRDLEKDHRLVKETLKKEGDKYHWVGVTKDPSKKRLWFRRLK